MSDYIVNIGKRAKEAAVRIGLLCETQKNNVLIAVSDALKDGADEIIAANDEDMKAAALAGVSKAMQDRLKLDKSRIDAMALGLCQIAELKDPIGEVLSQNELANGLCVQKVRVPFGVVGIIFESRPNVTADAFGLCFKTGNAVILRGGSDAINSIKAIAGIIRKALKANGINEDALILIEDTNRAYVGELMQLKGYVDVLIPRGGAGLIKNVVENATVPVIETGTGNCHIYMDADCDSDMAINILLNAKTQRMGVCNACESLLVDRGCAGELVPRIYDALTQKGIEIRASKEAMSYAPSACTEFVEATEKDWQEEYLGPVISLGVVSGIDEAISHINRYSTHHSEAIITRSTENAERFLNEVDAACVYVNASTRFTDGFEFGFGAEIGISTQKLHARGPMGLNELTTYKYKIRGNGQVRA